MATPGVANWQAQILQGVGAPVTPSNLSFLNAWQRAEGGTAANNPFNTTQSYAGATPYNTLSGGGHVYNYPTAQAGLQATLETLQNGRYGPILSALKQSDPVAAANALGQSPWGTNASLVLKILGQNQTKTTPTPRALTSASKPATPASTPTVTPAAMPAQQQTSSLAPLLAAMFSSTPSTPAPTPQLQLPTPAASTYGNVSANPWAASFPIPSALPQLAAPPPALKTSSSDDALFASILGSLGKGSPGLGVAAPTPANQPSTPVDAATGAHGQKVTFHVQGKVTPEDQKAVLLAKQYLGTPYQWGGASPAGFDCSGLLQYVWGKQGVQIPRTTYDQFQSGKPVAKNQLQPGDAVFFTGSDPMNGLPGHVGMYIGNGKFIEAPHTGSVVRISNLVGRSDYVGARTFT